MGAHTSALRPEVLSDLQDCTNFTADEIREYYKEFIKDCPHGHLTMTVEDFKAAYAHVFPQGDATVFAEHVFRTFSRGTIGSIDFRVFLQALSIQLKGGFMEKLEWIFHLYDIDNTGYTSRDELLTMIEVSTAATAHHDRVRPPLLTMIEVSTAATAHRDRGQYGRHCSP
ncbi:Hippocalcin-like protein 1 [Lamellibrachia satsuma]|nr:Hippocalcin-like protein 1 [Lamellibrachia satsuma]